YVILRNKILNGELSDGSRLPPEEQLAREMNVGRITLRTALKRLEKKGMLRRVRGQGTFISIGNKPQGNLETGVQNVTDLPMPHHIKHKLLVLVQPEHINSSGLKICSGVEARATELGIEYEVMPLGTFRKCIQLNKNMDFVEQNGFTGIIMTGHTYLGNEPELEYIPRIKIPFILPFPSELDEFLGCLVTFDSPMRPAMFASLHWLRECGHKYIAFIGPKGAQDLHSFSEIEYRYLSDSDEPLFICAQPDFEEIRSALQDFLNHSRATVIFCYNPYYALAVMTALKEMNKDVPDDISVIGYSYNEQTLLNCNPPIAGIDLKLVERGRAAVEYLFFNQDRPPQIGFSLLKHPSVKIINQEE
ncbi:MAG: GntR family transcriptional regulator, partial [Victivallales bacterium]|nr:GntR family transcriptional regulator [Victivallales bacterium]